MRLRLSSVGSGFGIALLPFVAVLGTFGVRALSAAAQDGSTSARTITVRANQYRFDPIRIEVLQDDVLTVTFKAEDIPHSFTLDEYRISKRAAAGRSVTFEFRADRAGAFRFYCDLRFDRGCREMHGQLVVRPR